MTNKERAQKILSSLQYAAPEARQMHMELTMEKIEKALDEAECRGQEATLTHYDEIDAIHVSRAEIEGVREALRGEPCNPPKDECGRCRALATIDGWLKESK